MAPPPDPRAEVIALVNRFDRAFAGEPADVVRAALIYLIARDLLIQAIAAGASDDEIVAACTEFVRQGVPVARADLQALGVPLPRPQ